MVISDADFHYIRDFLYKKAAIVLDDGKGYLIESRLQPLAKRHGFSSRHSLGGRRGDDDQRDNFFRDVHPFEALKKNVLPELIKRRESARQLNIWCATASSAQEVYSIVMQLKENFPSSASWQINFYGNAAMARRTASVTFALDSVQPAVEDVHDTMCELVNIVAGNVMDVFSESSRLSLPTLIRGNDFKLLFPRHVLLSEVALAYTGEPVVVMLLGEDKLAARLEHSNGAASEGKS